MFKPNNNKYSRNKKNELKKDSVFKLSASNFLSQVDNPFYVKNHNSTYIYLLYTLYHYL